MKNTEKTITGMRLKGNQHDAVPHCPGIYIFKKDATPLYVGKAADLHSRVASYFRAAVQEKTRELLRRATHIEWVETLSEIEALLKEAELIKKYQPPFNIVMRSDINYFFVAVTSEEFPRIFVTHQQVKVRNKKSIPSLCIGPFTSGTALKYVLKLLRRVFPYCTCKSLHPRLCLNAEIQRCLGVCCLDAAHRKDETETAVRYRQNIKSIVAILNGKNARLIRELSRTMRRASADKNFERAALLRDQLKGVKNIFAHRHTLAPLRDTLKNDTQWTKIERVLLTLLPHSKAIRRVEGYDISNISGTAATGSMVIFTNGAPSKSEYRKFKIKTVLEPNDVGMLKEMLRRRIAHPEWRYPELMLIDGGKPQLNAALKELKNRGLESTIQLGALAKKQEEFYLPGQTAPIRINTLPQPVMHFLQRVRDESHRFAKKYHHKLREISYRPS